MPQCANRKWVFQGLYVDNHLSCFIVNSVLLGSFFVAFEYEEEFRKKVRGWEKKEKEVKMTWKKKDIKKNKENRKK